MVDPIPDLAGDHCLDGCPLCPVCPHRLWYVARVKEKQQEIAAAEVRPDE